MLKSKEILLIGGGGHCRSVIDVIEQEDQYLIAGIIDKPELVGTKVFDYEVIGNDDDLPSLAQKYSFAIVTVGQIASSGLKVKLYEKIKESGFIVPTIISPRAYVSKHAVIGEGSVIMHDAMVNAGAIVGKNCIINSKALIEHDCKIEDHCHISTGAILNGGVVVQSHTFVGSQVTTKEAVLIEKGSFIKAGSVVK